MARLKFLRDFTLRVDASSSRIWPADWQGNVEDAGVAWKAVDGGHAEFVGEAPARPLEPIPEGWEKLKAADLVDLARRLGASDEVKTKDAAAEFIVGLAAKSQLF